MSAGIRLGLLYFAVVVLVGGTGSQTVWANMAPPPIRTETVEVASVQVFLNPYDAETRIVIPQSVFAEMSRTARETTPTRFESRQPQVSRSTVTNRTVVAGLTVSALLVGGGIVTVLVRRRRGRAAFAVAVALVAGMGIVIGTTGADIPPAPSDYPMDKVESRREPATPATSRSGFSLGRPLKAEVVLETYSDGKSVILYLGKDLAPKVYELTKSIAPPSFEMGREDFTGNGGYGEDPAAGPLRNDVP